MLGKRTLIVRTLLGVCLVASACSGGGEDAAEGELDGFCERAIEYMRFEPTLGRVASDPAQTKVFIEAWEARLVVLADRAPDDVRPDVEEIQVSVDALDAELETVGYDVLALTVEQLDDLDALADGDGSEADRRFRGYVDEQCGAAPSALSEDEVAELVDGSDDADVDAEVSAALAEQLEMLLGVSPESSRCLASSLDPAALDALLGGDQLSDEVTTELLEVIDECGITADDLVGG